MGGMQTFQVTFNHLDLFSYIGGFSGAASSLVLGYQKLDPKTAFNGALTDPTAFAKSSFAQARRWDRRASKHACWTHET